MDLPVTLLIGVGVSMDCLAVAIAGSISMRSLSSRQILRASFSFGFFQSAMLILGWLAGQTVVDIVADYDHWVAFGLLALVGTRMIWESFSSDESDRQRTDITRGLTLLTLSVATSIDSLAVGLSLAFLESRILIAALLIGSVTFAISGAGFYSGRRIGGSMGRWAEIFGGVVLMGIGIRILITHIF